MTMARPLRARILSYRRVVLVLTSCALYPLRPPKLSQVKAWSRSPDRIGITPNDFVILVEVSFKKENGTKLLGPMVLVLF
jgi:hypothetical protein